MAVLSMLAAWLATVTAAAPVHVRLGLVIERSPLVSPFAAAGAVEEAAAVWAPYGISVLRVPSASCLPEACDQVIMVRFSDRALSGTVPEYFGETHLAAIRFERDGTPTNQITVYYPGVLRLANMLGPRNPLAIRIAGRALAHEIGHYLLRSPLHAPSGLMQAVHHARDLARIDRSAFVLSATEISRMLSFRDWSVECDIGTR